LEIDDQMTIKTYSNIIFETKDTYKAMITINRPAMLNAIDYASLQELKDALLKIQKSNDLRVFLITGSGMKSFVVGADLKEMESNARYPKKMKAFEELGREVIGLIDGLDIPSVCAINGYALGLGLQMALACTFRIASLNAMFGLPEINMGFFPSMGATQRLTRLIGEAKTMEMILTGETIEATEAYRIGLVNRIMSQVEFPAFVEKFVDGLAERSPIAMKLAISAIRRGKTMSLHDGLAYEAKLSEECLRSEDLKEVKRALAEKRKPEFKNI